MPKFSAQQITVALDILSFINLTFYAMLASNLPLSERLTTLIWCIINYFYLHSQVKCTIINEWDINRIENIRQNKKESIWRNYYVFKSLFSMWVINFEKPFYKEVHPIVRRKLYVKCIFLNLSYNHLHLIYGGLRHKKFCKSQRPLFIPKYDSRAFLSFLINF